jgi:hypothetical protein
MTVRHPPRREPRVLAVSLAPTGLHFACADPWVVRSAGPIRGTIRSRTAALLRVARREKPTALFSTDASLELQIKSVARITGAVVIAGPLPHLPVHVARDLYLDLNLVAPGSLGPIAALAISAVLHGTVPSRTYANHRHPTPLRRR